MYLTGCIGGWALSVLWPFLGEGPTDNTLPAKPVLTITSINNQ